MVGLFMNLSNVAITIVKPLKIVKGIKIILVKENIHFDLLHLCISWNLNWKVVRFTMLTWWDNIRCNATLNITREVEVPTTWAPLKVQGTPYGGVSYRSNVDQMILTHLLIAIFQSGAYICVGWWVGGGLNSLII